MTHPEHCSNESEKTTEKQKRELALENLIQKRSDG